MTCSDGLARIKVKDEENFVESSLVIKSTRLEDSGTYTVTPVNKNEDNILVSAIVKVIVIGKFLWSRLVFRPVSVEI